MIKLITLDAEGAVLEVVEKPKRYRPSEKYHGFLRQKDGHYVKKLGHPMNIHDILLKKTLEEMEIKRQNDLIEAEKAKNRPPPLPIISSVIPISRYNRDQPPECRVFTLKPFGTKYTLDYWRKMFSWEKAFYPRNCTRFEICKPLGKIGIDEIDNHKNYDGTTLFQAIEVSEIHSTVKIWNRFNLTQIADFMITDCVLMPMCEDWE